MVETLEAFASAQVSARVLEGALRTGEQDRVPDGGEALRRFVERDLARATGEALGGEVAAAVTEALRGMTRMLPDPDETSHVRSRTPATHPALPWSARPMPSATPAPEPTFSKQPTATPPELALPMVILVTRDREREREIAAWLGDRAALQVAYDAVHLLQSVEVAMNLAPVIVVDCVSPAVRLETLLTLAGELPTGATVVLWGVGAEVEVDDFALEHGAGRFIRCGVEASARDLGALLMPFIER
ncbi:MAG: hypothetical protein GXP55_14380 [Deltaproteobacteria bacterium]|nr:hypothetical protein [Deltaproteobacteria bacterium]